MSSSDICLGNNVFVIVVVIVVALDPYALVSPFVRSFLESPSHRDLVVLGFHSILKAAHLLL